MKVYFYIHTFTYITFNITLHICGPNSYFAFCALLVASFLFYFEGGNTAASVSSFTCLAPLALINQSGPSSLFPLRVISFSCTLCQLISVHLVCWGFQSSLNVLSTINGLSLCFSWTFCLLPPVFLDVPAVYLLQFWPLPAINLLCVSFLVINHLNFTSESWSLPFFRGW